MITEILLQTAPFHYYTDYLLLSLYSNASFHYIYTANCGGKNKCSNLCSTAVKILERNSDKKCKMMFQPLSSHQIIIK